MATGHQSRIKEETIIKAGKYLNHVCTHLAAHQNRMSGKEKVEIANLYNQSYGLFYSATRVGYITVLDMRAGKAKCNLDKFEPIHVRKVLEAHYKHHNDMLRKRKEESAKLENTKVHKKEVRNRRAEVTETEKPTKTIPVTKKTNHPTQAKHELSPETTMSPSLQKEVRKYNKKRVFSIFWGLIKFNY